MGMSAKKPVPTWVALLLAVALASVWYGSCQLWRCSVDDQIQENRERALRLP